MFGISFFEIGLVMLVALIVVGPQKLPGMLRTVGQWIGAARRLTTQVRAQSGIDDILRAEGLEGGLSELRGMLRGDFSGYSRRPPASGSSTIVDPYAEATSFDLSREYPPEGPDAQGAIADDLFDSTGADSPELVGATASENETTP